MRSFLYFSIIYINIAHCSIRDRAVRLSSYALDLASTIFYASPRGVNNQLITITLKGWIGMSKTKRGFTLVGIVGMLLVSGCMWSPVDGLEVSDRDALIQFGGYASAPNVEVIVEAYDPTTLQYRPLYGVQAANTPVDSQGALYAWALEASIPDAFWAKSLTGSRTKVRARQGDAILPTFNEEAQNCAIYEVLLGTSIIQAGYYCASGNEARIVTEGSSVADIIKDLEATQAAIVDKRKRAAEAFEDFEQKSRQIYNIMTQILKELNDLRARTVRNLL